MHLLEELRNQLGLFTLVVRKLRVYVFSSHEGYWSVSSRK